MSEYRYFRNPRQSQSALRRELAGQAANAFLAEYRSKRPRATRKTVSPVGSGAIDCSGVYVIRAASDLVKIGMSKDPEARLKDLQVGHADPLILHGFVECMNARRVEREMHRHFSHRRERGEWFMVSTDEALAKVRETAAMSDRIEKSLQSR